MNDDPNGRSPLLDSLFRAQLEHTRKMIDDSLGEYGYGDDGYDYLTSALSLSMTMLDLHYERDEEGLMKLLNGPTLKALADDDHGALSALACDGIAPAFYDVAPALNDE